MKTVFAVANVCCLLALESVAQVRQVGRLRHFALTESSGLVASRQYPGVFWTHNDGGFQFLFAVNKSGRNLGAFQVPGNLIDWEDIAVDNLGNLYLADIGSNGMVRTHVAIHRVREPNPYARYGNAKILQSWFVRFPEGPIQDCESFFVHKKHGYLITKTRTNDLVHMYRFALADRSRSVLLQFVTTIPVNDSVSAADLSVDGRRLALVTGEGVHLIFVNGRPGSAGSAEQRFVELVDTFMEGGTFFGRGFLTSSETRQLRLFTSDFFQCQTAPRLTLAPTNQTVLAGATVRFDSAATGCPNPRFRWTHNGVIIPSATNAILVLSNVAPGLEGTYQLTAYNRFGAVSNAALLTVRLRPRVRITEVMSNPVADSPVPTADWWELTNLESVPIDLTGWRFNDSVGGLNDPFVFTDGPVIEPGETVVFVEGLTAQQFRQWWGDDNLPPDLQVITYGGTGLSFRATGDTLSLWDAVSTDSADTVDRVTFGAADPGVSFNYDPESGVFGIPAQAGVNGAFPAAETDDIGSPGVIDGP